MKYGGANIAGGVKPEEYHQHLVLPLWAFLSLPTFIDRANIWCIPWAHYNWWSISFSIRWYNIFSVNGFGCWLATCIFLIYAFGVTVLGDYVHILHFGLGSKDVQERICRECLTGEKNICLAITEPGAGSDVANIQTEAVLSPGLCSTHFCC